MFLSSYNTGWKVRHVICFDRCGIVPSDDAETTVVVVSIIYVLIFASYFNSRNLTLKIVVNLPLGTVPTFDIGLVQRNFSKLILIWWHIHTVQNMYIFICLT